jgi:hypothetical protein
MAEADGVRALKEHASIGWSTAFMVCIIGIICMVHPLKTIDWPGFFIGSAMAGYCLRQFVRTKFLARRANAETSQQDSTAEGSANK